jgi:hypothetical protein
MPRRWIITAVLLCTSLSFAQESATYSSSKTQIARTFGESGAVMPTSATRVETNSLTEAATMEPLRPTRFGSCEESADPHACSFQWRSALEQAAQFLVIQHMLNMPTYNGTLKGPFFKDWFDSLKHYRFSRFQDDDPFIVNYVGHPMMGSVVSWIAIQNDPRGRVQTIGTKKAYWKSRAKALAFASVYATQWEIGPFSETSIGNLGSFKYYSASAHHMTNGTGFTDMLVTPTAGVTWSMGEDLIDKYLIRRLEGHSTNPLYRMSISMLNPTRSAANLLRWKAPWYRDTRNRD